MNCYWEIKLVMARSPRSSSMMDSRQSRVLMVLMGLLRHGHLGDAVTCQPPAGYIIKTSVDKYYKPVKNSVTWQVARAACFSEGTILVELRTAAEYQAIRPLYGNISNMFKYMYICV